MIIRVGQPQRFAVIAKEVVEDKRLSFRARGVIAWLLAKPDDWHIDSETIARQGKEGRDAVRTALNELADCGYLQREKRQVEGGRWVTEAVLFAQQPTPENPSSVPPGETPHKSWSHRRLGNRRPENRQSESQALSTEDGYASTGSGPGYAHFRTASDERARLDAWKAEAAPPPPNLRSMLDGQNREVS